MGVTKPTMITQGHELIQIDHRRLGVHHDIAHHMVPALMNLTMDHLTKGPLVESPMVLASIPTHLIAETQGVMALDPVVQVEEVPMVSIPVPVDLVPEDQAMMVPEALVATVLGDTVPALVDLVEAVLGALVPVLVDLVVVILEALDHLQAPAGWDDHRWRQQVLSVRQMSKHSPS